MCVHHHDSVTRSMSTAWNDPHIAYNEYINSKRLSALQQRELCVTALKHSPSKRKSISRPLRPLEGDFDSTGKPVVETLVHSFNTLSTIHIYEITEPLNMYYKQIARDVLLLASRYNNNKSIRLIVGKLLFSLFYIIIYLSRHS